MPTLDLQQLTAQALAHHQAGRLNEAEAAYRRIVAAPGAPAPLLANAHYNLAVLLRVEGRLEEAVRQFEAAVRLRPGHAATHNNRGAVLQALGRSDEAEASLRRAIALAPAHANAHYNLGRVLRAQGRLEDAAAAFGRAVALKPEDADAREALALALQGLGRQDEAEGHLRRALALQPDAARIHDNLGRVLHDQGRAEAALAEHRRAASLDPRLAAAHDNLGFVLAGLGRLEEAEAAYRQAIAVDPAGADAYNNLGQALHEQGRLEEAIAAFDQALARRPGWAEAEWNRALVQLLLGRFQEGWPGYERRRDLRDFGARLLPPVWDGGDLDGRTVLLHAEQGAGDTIQFVRYAPRLKARGARVILEAPPELVRLLATAEGIDQVVERGRPLPGFDQRAPLPSLPALLHTDEHSIPAAACYLSADSEAVMAWRERLSRRPGLKAGLLWSGNPGNSRNPIRSIPVEAMARLIDVPGVAWTSVQLGASAEALKTLGDIEDGARELSDWADTAALLSALDVMVSVETGAAHLAGALGVRTFLLLPFVPDWRWLLGRQDSPWYPSVRLFRQVRRGDWAEPIAAAHEALRALALG